MHILAPVILKYLCCIHNLPHEELDFYIENRDGKEVSIDLEPGDAVIYDGPNAVHWREEYCGEEYIQTFHHYVS